MTISHGDVPGFFNVIEVGCVSITGGVDDPMVSIGFVKDNTERKRGWLSVSGEAHNGEGLLVRGQSLRGNWQR